jgi:hypothetical protein
VKGFSQKLLHHAYMEKVLKKTLHNPSPDARRRALCRLYKKSFRSTPAPAAGVVAL